MKDFKKNIKTLILGLFLTLVIAGCKSDGEEIEQPEKIYYDQAQARMSSGNYFGAIESLEAIDTCLLYTSPSPRDPSISRMPSSA